MMRLAMKIIVTLIWIVSIIVNVFINSSEDTLKINYVLSCPVVIMYIWIV